MAAAIELGYPITINIAEDDEIIEHDIDYTTSKFTDSDKYAAVYEVALSIALDEERIGLDCPMYNTNNYPNIKVFEKRKQIV